MEIGGLQVGSHIGRFGANLMTTTKGLFEQVQESIQQELDGVEDYLNKKGTAASHTRSASRSSSRWVYAVAISCVSSQN